MDSNNPKAYPPADYPSLGPQNGHQPGFQPQGPQGYPSSAQQMPMPMQPPQYEANPNMMHQPNMMHHQPVITQQPTTTVFVQAAHYGPDPQYMTCPSCRSPITTSVKYEPSVKTHLIAGFICLVGCWFGCCMIPYCVDSCQSATHSCPGCGAYLGKQD